VVTRADAEQPTMDLVRGHIVVRSDTKCLLTADSLPMDRGLTQKFSGLKEIVRLRRIRSEAIAVQCRRQFRIAICRLPGARW
jgi:hypothetical protein